MQQQSGGLGREHEPGDGQQQHEGLAEDEGTVLLCGPPSILRQIVLIARPKTHQSEIAPEGDDEEPQEPQAGKNASGDTNPADGRGTDHCLGFQ